MSLPLIFWCQHRMALRSGTSPSIGCRSTPGAKSRWRWWKKTRLHSVTWPTFQYFSHLFHSFESLFHYFLCFPPLSLTWNIKAKWASTWQKWLGVELKRLPSQGRGCTGEGLEGSEAFVGQRRGLGLWHRTPRAATLQNGAPSWAQELSGHR